MTKEDQEMWIKSYYGEEAFNFFMSEIERLKNYNDNLAKELEVKHEYPNIVDVYREALAKTARKELIKVWLRGAKEYEIKIPNLPKIWTEALYKKAKMGVRNEKEA
jgi:hypothetical protein